MAAEASTLSPPVETAADAKKSKRAPRLPEIQLTKATLESYTLIFLKKESAQHRAYFELYAADKKEGDAEPEPQYRVAFPSLRPASVSVANDEHNPRQLQIRVTVSVDCESVALMNLVAEKLVISLGEGFSARRVGIPSQELPGLMTFTASAPKALMQSLMLRSTDRSKMWGFGFSYLGVYDNTTNTGSVEITPNLSMCDLATLGDAKRSTAASGAVSTLSSLPARVCC